MRIGGPTWQFIKYSDGFHPWRQAIWAAQVIGHDTGKRANRATFYMNKHAKNEL